MRFLSVCSGIEAASVAWQPLGWKAAAFSEIEPFPCSVLAHHYPDVPNLGDMTKFKDWPDDLSIDLLCGGTPCQSFSVAGLRKGLSDPRGNLMLTYLAIAAKYRPKWVVWENVPGVLSSWSGADETGALHEGQDEWEGDETSDFSCFLAGLEELGYGWAFRSLDAQFAGLAQRRERVFVVGCLGDWHGAAAVLLERHSLSGHPPPRREAGQIVTPTIRAGASNGGAGHGARSGDSKDELIVPVAGTLEAAGGRSRGAGTPTAMLIAGTLQANGKAAGSATQQDAETGMLVTHSLRGEGFDASEDGTGRGTPLVPVAFNWQGGGTQTTLGYDALNQIAGTLVKDQTQAVHAAMQVRRLTPRECERLQGFPDDYTLIPHRGKPAADGPRYKALGNSWAVPCARWIGQRIEAVETITQKQLEAA
jgi:DNA (cytosine-5)-methyltransferase 1